MLVFDLCAGTKSATKYFRDKYQVVTIDLEEKHKPDILADVRALPLAKVKPFFIWASPPCTEFAREFMPWSRKGIEPDMSIYRACMDFIEKCDPTYWILENVKGAIKYFGKPRQIIGPFCLWGVFPPIGVKLVMRKKESMSSTWDVQRGAIPDQLAKAVYKSVTSQLTYIDNQSIIQVGD